MNTGRLARRLALAAGGSAIVAMGAVTAGCGSGESPAPSTTPSPTQKNISTHGPNSFTPPITATPVPTGLPGPNHTG